MTTNQIVKLGTALGICYAVYKFAPQAVIKTAAVGVGATIVARQLPYVGDALGA